MVGRSVIRFLFVCVLIVFLASCSEPLVNAPPTSVSATTGKALPEERVKASILAAGKQTRIQWDMEELKPGLIRARLNFKDKHKITLDIPYSAGSYQIVYVDSQMMRYEPSARPGGTARIGSHYVEWVRELDEAIKANLRAVAGSS